ncbi:MAG TPA: DUF4157 domain-containing protein [Pyrinomonadaceae bacterium]|nr:DUF4157 domain-containing protein [Pyrinomonadaceae bacterium]
MQQGLAKPGKPLDEQTRRSMEAGLGHDFSNVRVHADDQADVAARSLSASAYTVGNDIVFASGKYDPESAAGKERIAHELTHVVQQRRNQGSSTSPAHEAEARNAGALLGSGGRMSVAQAAPSGAVQFDKDKDDNALDEKAKKIIAITADTKKTAEQKAVAVVQAIIDEYYASEKSIIDSVAFDNAKAGSGVQASQKFAKGNKPEESTGIIYVGDDFFKGVTEKHFARRVLQVGHEIEHIHQWREGLSGGHKANEREFLAFYHEATLSEKPGTGRMVPGTRLRLIHAALDNYVCMPAEKQTEQAAKQKELIASRTSIIDAGTKAEKEVPTECKK